MFERLLAIAGQTSQAPSTTLVDHGRESIESYGVWASCIGQAALGAAVNPTHAKQGWVAQFYRDLYINRYNVCKHRNNFQNRALFFIPGKGRTGMTPK